MLTVRDKIILLVLIFSTFVYVGYQSLWTTNLIKIAGLKEEKATILNCTGDLALLKKETEQLKKIEKETQATVNNVKSLSGGLTATNEEFLVFLGNSAKENNVIVSKFNELGAETENGIYRVFFDFELKGKSTGINKVLEDIENLGIKCSFGSISYRQNEEYDYLKRFFDGLSKLPWYQEEKESEGTDVYEQQEEEKKETTETKKPIEESTVEQLPKPPLIQEKPTDPIEPPIDTEENIPDISERLNDLLKQTSYISKKSANIAFSMNTENIAQSNYKVGQNMKLSATICLIMYNEPSFETSFMNKSESDLYAVF